MKKRPKIDPKIRKDKHGNPKEVFLEIETFNYILSEINNLEEKISKLKKDKNIK